MAEEFETNVEISKVYEGNSGENQYGEWTAYNFYVKDDDRKFSWFKSSSKPIMPVQGMQIKLMEYVEKITQKDDKTYTNYNVSRIVLHGDAHKKTPEAGTMEKLRELSKPAPKRDSSLTMYISYAKDIIGRAMDYSPDAFKGLSINQITDMVVDEGLRMYDRAHSVDTEHVKEHTHDVPDNEPRQEPDFPEDRFPPSEYYGEQP